MNGAESADAKKKIEEVFTKWDINGSGTIAADKLQKVLQSIGIDNADISKKVSAGSKNGVVQWQDFLDTIFSNGKQRDSHKEAKKHWHFAEHEVAEAQHHDPDHPYFAEIVHLRQTVERLRTQKLVSNGALLSKPKQATIVDNTILFLPPRAVHHLDLEPNMDDKGDKIKEMWFGRVWELRELLKLKHLEKKKNDGGDSKKKPPPVETLSDEAKAELEHKMKDPFMLVRLRRMAAHWRGAHYRNHCKLAVLEKLRYANLMGTLIYAHGSGGMSWDNMRLCRQICKLGLLVICPDGFAHPPESAMGQLRRKDILPLTQAHMNVDYWANDLIYASGASGDATYSTDAGNVLDNPDDYRDLYEKCYQLRRSELHLIISKLPLYIKTRGFFLGGTSEGGMTIARFDDQRYGKMVLGRFINSFSVEYCYFTPVPEAAELGGQLDVPTLNIIGDLDEYFGPEDSVASIVASDKEHGYGDDQLTGNAYNTMVRQGVKCGLVTVLTGGMHGPCTTHDNFLRQLFESFFTRPAEICYLNEIWGVDHTRSHLTSNVERSTLDDVDARTKWWRIRVKQIKVPRMRQPQTTSLKEVEAIRMAKLSQTAQMDSKLQEEKLALEAERMMHKVMLDGIRKKKAEGSLANAPGPANYYSKGQKSLQTLRSLKAMGGTVQGTEEATEQPAEPAATEEKPAES